MKQRKIMIYIHIYKYFIFIIIYFLKHYMRVDSSFAYRQYKYLGSCEFNSQDTKIEQKYLLMKNFKFHSLSQMLQIDEFVSNFLYIQFASSQSQREITFYLKFYQQIFVFILKVATKVHSNSYIVASKLEIHIYQLIFLKLILLAISILQIPKLSSLLYKKQREIIAKVTRDTNKPKYPNSPQQMTIQQLMQKIEQPTYYKTHAYLANKQNKASLNQSKNSQQQKLPPSNYLYPVSYSYENTPTSHENTSNNLASKSPSFAASPKFTPTNSTWVSPSKFKQDPQMQARIDCAVKNGYNGTTRNNPVPQNSGTSNSNHSATPQNNLAVNNGGSWNNKTYSNNNSWSTQQDQTTKFSYNFFNGLSNQNQNQPSHCYQNDRILENPIFNAISRAQSKHNVTPYGQPYQYQSPSSW